LVLKFISNIYTLLDMKNKLKQLEIKKLVQEYNFLLSEDEYRLEVIEEHKPIFMEKVGEIKKRLDIKPNLDKINEFTKNQEIENEENRLKSEDVSDSTKNKIKKIYREIVKLTHPDKINSENYLEVYHRATKYSNQFNILGLFQICVELNIPIELDMEDIDVLNFLIKQKKDDIKKIDSSFIWLWVSGINDEEKDKIVENFVKQTS
jgi:hypothetical protein